MKVTLIIPPSGFLIDERVFPSLGVLQVGAALEQQGIEVDVVDLSGKSANYPFRTADVYGITATAPQMPAAFQIAQQLRDQHPGSRIVLGGPHPTLLQASARRGVQRAIDDMMELSTVFDTVVAGDGQKAILSAIQPHAPVLIDADSLDSNYWMTPADLDSSPLPARHLIDLPSYHYTIDSTPTMSLIAQLGCPFGCVFCGGRRSPFLRKVRMRSTANVIAEMEHLYLSYGTRGFMFLDDELNVNNGFMELLTSIIDLQHKHGTTFRLRGLLKSELVTPPMAELMYRAGFRQVLIGFESGSDRILTNIEKHATVAQNTNCVAILRAHGISVKALMSFGHAGETHSTIRATRDWLLQVRPDDFDITIITVYPGTPYYDDAKPHGTDWVYRAKTTEDRLYYSTVDHKHDVNFYKGMPYHYRSYVWTDALSSTDLVGLRDATETEVRSALSIPFPSAPAAVQYEHSMGLR